MLISHIKARVMCQCPWRDARNCDSGTRRRRVVSVEPLDVEDGDLSAIKRDPDVMGLAAPLLLVSTRLVSPSSSGGTETPHGHMLSLCPSVHKYWHLQVTV